MDKSSKNSATKDQDEVKKQVSAEKQEIEEDAQNQKNEAMVQKNKKESSSVDPSPKSEDEDLAEYQSFYAWIHSSEKDVPDSHENIFSKMFNHDAHFLSDIDSSEVEDEESDYDNTVDSCDNDSDESDNDGSDCEGDSFGSDESGEKPQKKKIKPVKDSKESSEEVSEEKLAKTQKKPVKDSKEGREEVSEEKSAKTQKKIKDVEMVDTATSGKKAANTSATSQSGFLAAELSGKKTAFADEE